LKARSSKKFVGLTIGCLVPPAANEKQRWPLCGKRLFPVILSEVEGSLAIVSLLKSEIPRLRSE